MLKTGSDHKVIFLFHSSVFTLLLFIKVVSCDHYKSHQDIPTEMFHPWKTMSWATLCFSLYHKLQNNVILICRITTLLSIETFLYYIWCSQLLWYCFLLCKQKKIDWLQTKLWLCLTLCLHLLSIKHSCSINDPLHMFDIVYFLPHKQLERF